MRKLTMLFLAVISWLQYSLWLGKNGLYDYIRINEDVVAQQKKNLKLKRRNNQLFLEIDDLIGGQEALEERARSELGMIKTGETFYRVFPNNKKRCTVFDFQNNIKNST